MKVLSALDFLKPEEFVTKGDTVEGGKAAFARGQAAALMVKEVFIAVDRTWTALFKEGGHASSRECFGITPNTAQLLRGLIKSGVRISVSVVVNGVQSRTVIRDGR